MSTKKRASDNADSARRKKPRLSQSQPEEENTPGPSLLRADEVDFPRGGGTNLSAAEYKTVKAEALKELRDELVFKDGKDSNNAKSKKAKAGRLQGMRKASAPSNESSDTVRVESLNYKRIVVGMKLLCEIAAVNPYMLIVSLPNQLMGHIPITQISSQLTTQLEVADGANNEEGGEESSSDLDIPDLRELFRPGQYLRAVVTAIKPAGTSGHLGMGHARDSLEKSSRRVELGTIPGYVNEGLLKTDLQPGVTLSGAIKSIEDHGYVVELGIPEVKGFLPFKAVNRQDQDDDTRMFVGTLVSVVVEKMRSDGRTCLLSADPLSIRTIVRKELTNVASLLPGTLVSTLVTATNSSGLNVQLFGSLTGTLDTYHLPKAPTSYKAGEKLKARILYSIPGTSPLQLSLTASDHVLGFEVKRSGSKPVVDAYPIGTTLAKVTVTRVESERGLLVDVDDGLQGFIHISHLSDDHVPSLSPSSGHWKLGSVHEARVIGYHPFDGILQLSLKPTVLAQKFLRVDDVHVGELIKGTVKKLTGTGLFVAISGNVDGVIWPNHFADIVLKHPQKRFSPGANVKCKVLVVDPERKRVVLTAKKTLVESALPIIAHLDDVEVGLVTFGVVLKVLEKSVIVEFFNNIRAHIIAREASDVPTSNLTETFPIGKPVKVRILSVDRASGKITASVRQANSADVALGDPKSVEIGQTVSGTIADIHAESVVLSIQPTNVRALMSISNLANSRGTTDTDIRNTLTRGETLDELVVVSRNLDKGIVIVAKKPKKPTPQRSGVQLSTVAIGDKVSGRVARYSRQGAVVQFPGQITGSLHPTDACDNFEIGTPVPNVGTIVEAVVLSVDKSKRQLILSTRESRVRHTEDHIVVVDREITDVSDLNINESVRGFVKSVTEKGLFVSLGRDLDARVQIKELFDNFVKDWKGRFEVNQVVSGRIISYDVEKKQVEMTLRSKTSSKTRAAPASLGDYSIGQKIEGRVKKIEEYGLFISIDGTKLSGLCHKSEITDSKDADIAMALRNFREGDSVKAVVIAIDAEKRRISFSLKPSHFDAEDLKSEHEQEGNGTTSDNDVTEDENVHMVDGDGASDDESEADDAADGEGMDIDGFLSSLSGNASAPSTKTSAESPAAVLKLQTGFQWSNTAPEVEEAASTDEDDEGDTKAKKKRKRKMVIEDDVTAEMHTKTPESTADFERHLLASPNSSYLWIQYMSFQLQLAEIEKARNVGRRALQAISIREEQEKLNVWIALLNLENTYGSDESLEALFKEAARHNDSKTVHLRLAAILDQSQKTEKAEEQFKRTCKKFGQSSKVWTLLGEHYFKRGESEDARKLLPRSLQSLEKRKHLKTISKFAQMEYKLGDPERGRTIFEGIIDSHPKRWDLWQIFIDMEAGQKDTQYVRSLFERVFLLNMTSFKAKAFFKKWLDLERRIGDEEGAQRVKGKAIDWTRQKASA